MTRIIACNRLIGLLRLDLTGDCLDAIADRDLRDLLLKAIGRARVLLADAEAAAKLAPPTASR